MRLFRQRSRRPEKRTTVVPILVDLESPFAGNVEKNLAYARICMRDSLDRGEYPIASHLLYTQPGIVDDAIPHERELGIQAGKAWAVFAQKTVVYTDLGISPGMQAGIEDARARGRPVEYRALGFRVGLMEEDKTLAAFNDLGISG